MKKKTQFRDMAALTLFRQGEIGEGVAFEPPTNFEGL